MDDYTRYPTTALLLCSSECVKLNRPSQDCLHHFKYQKCQGRTQQHVLTPVASHRERSSQMPWGSVPTSSVQACSCSLPWWTLLLGKNVQTKQLEEKPFCGKGGKWMNRWATRRCYSHRFMQNITLGNFWQTAWLQFYDHMEGDEWTIFLVGEFSQCFSREIIHVLHIKGRHGQASQPY